MDYTKSYFFNLKSKKKLKTILNISRNLYLNDKYINKKINVFVNKNGRLIEAPSKDILAIQYRILYGLRDVGMPTYVFSTQKRGYLALLEEHNKYQHTLRCDINKFFYNIKREYVYRFFCDKLQTSCDVAKILTDYSTIDLNKKGESVLNTISFKEISSNHLIVGAPQSSILSILVNYDLFDELNKLSNARGIVFSAYADDLFFSSNDSITENFRLEVFSTIKKYNYDINMAKFNLEMS